MITDALLLLPLLLVLLAAILAAAYGLPALNRRLSITRAAWLLGLLPLAAFALLLRQIPVVTAGEVLGFGVDWLPSLGLRATLYFDALSALFALLITGIGVLVVIYAGYYFKGDATAWRFLSYLFLFMTSMLGVVMAGDVITLFVFWEGTSITSFLLVAYKTKDEAARRGAFRALFITGGGGIALLAGLLFVAAGAGSAELPTILASGDRLRQSPLYLVMLALVAFGAFTKSAQVPAHIWLPGAMSAPTPASAFLHSATMVKAGIYLMARLNPALGNTDVWFWLLSLVGLITMLTGAYLGFKQNELKALLAYSTISQLGVLMMLIGQETEIAFKALVIGITAHALYKSALFMVAGIVDHESGTRDLRRLGGLRRTMPVTFAIALIAALSMAGLPPLFGFLAKETLLATATHPAVPPAINTLFPLAAVLAGALILAQAGMFLWDTFLGKPRDPAVHGHEAPAGMFLAPAMPALLSVMISALPEPEPIAQFLAGAAAAAFGAKVKVSLALWTGITVPLLLSLVAVSLGTLILWRRRGVRAWLERLTPRLDFDAFYGAVLAGIDRLAAAATRLQNGHLRSYMTIIFAGVGVLVLLFGRPALPALAGQLRLPEFGAAGEMAVLRIFALLFAVAAALTTVILRNGFFAILALSVSGLAIAILMVLEPAPDVALVQIVVDVLTTLILVLALLRVPKAQRLVAWQRSLFQNRPQFLRDLLIAVGGGLIMTMISLAALISRPRASLVTPFYEAGAKTLTGAKDIVGAIVVDFRLFDTMIEITVFSMAGLGIYALLRYASRYAGDRGEPIDELPPPDVSVVSGTTAGIGGRRTSAFVRLLAYASLPMATVLAVTHMMYGHDQPGDGFTAGVIMSLAIGFWYVVFGYHEVKHRLTWLRPSPLIGSGILLAVITGGIGLWANGVLFSPVDMGALLGLPLPRGFNLSTSFLTEVAICLSVLGSASLMIDTLGHPGYHDPESDHHWEEIPVKRI